MQSKRKQRKKHSSFHHHFIINTSQTSLETKAKIIHTHTYKQATVKEIDTATDDEKHSPV